MVSRRGWTGVGVVIVLLTLGGTMEAQTSAPPTKAESIVVPITAAADKFQKAIGEGLGQRLEELRAGLKESGARVRAALDAAQREGTDTANAKYEEVVSTELEHVQQALVAVGAERRGVLAAQQGLSTQLDKVRESLVQRQATLARETKAREATVEQLNADLVALAEKHRARIDANQPLPPEDDLRARALAAQLQIAQQQAALTARGAQDADGRLTKLRGFEGQLTAAGGEYGLLFDRADGQIKLLGQVAQMRREGVEVAAVIGQLNKVGQQLAAVDAALNDTASTLDELVGAPLLGDQATVVMPTPAVKRMAGIDILKNILGGRKGGAQ